MVIQNAEDAAECYKNFEDWKYADKEAAWKWMYEQGRIAGEANALFDRDADLRRTGRTTRMLDEAKELARQGLAVHVIAATYAHAKNLERIAGDECQQLGIRFETPDSLGNFDWKTMRLITGHQNCVVLADHFAIETYFAQMLEMLHRYDVPPIR